jgi:hypothetical protein
MQLESLATTNAAAAGQAPTTLTRLTSALLGVAASVYREHRIVLWLALGYVVIGGVALTALNRPWPIAIINAPFAFIWMFCSGLWIGWQYLRSPKRLRRSLPASRVLGAILVAILVVPVQITFQALKESIGTVIGFTADPFLHRLDTLLHGKMAWLWLEPILASPWLVRSIDVLYISWFAGLLGFVLWASWTRHRALRQRALIAFLLMWMGAGTVAAGALASAGPVYYRQVVAGADPYEPLVARLDSIGAEQGHLWARSTQQYLWEAERSGHGGQFGGVAAMPSLHVGIAVLFALVAWSLSRPLGGLLAIYAAAIQVASVILAWHYAVDGYFGTLLAVASWAVAGTLARLQTS